ncbi:MAG: NapC/NirT family cytochrome c [Actinobacteria bacterium]|nr:NapC/NirT family cytochrome c [Actinomycetota bacterium]
MDLRRRIAWIALSGVVLLVLVTAWGFRETSKPRFCSSCHLIQPFEATWEKSTHKTYGVVCIDCHFEPGAVGYSKGKIYSFIKLTQFAAGQTERKPEAAKLVLRSACLQCHEYIRDPQDPRYPKNIVVQGITFPHDFHLNVANLTCADCHSALVHGPELVGPEKPQAAADPAFCSKCHTGDIAPILFGPIEPVGREHPGAPKIDVKVWRNIHWRMAKGPATVDGVSYDKIEKDTCLACHQEPTVAKVCKGCHFARVPEFTASIAAEKASLFPVGLFFYLFVLFMVAVILRGRDKERFFSSLALRLIAVAVILSDAYVVYLIVRDVLHSQAGAHEIGPTTVWVSYLLLSVAMVGLLLFEAGLLPHPLRPVRFSPTPESEFLVPRPIRRLAVKRGASSEAGAMRRAGPIAPEAAAAPGGPASEEAPGTGGARPSPPEDQHD